MNSITTNYRRRDVIMKSSLIAVFGFIFLMVAVPFATPQQTSQPIPKFKPHQALAATNASLLSLKGEQ